ncbi:MAG: cytochrome c biogenesis protein ResB [Anaerolineae bacterium]
MAEDNLAPNVSRREPLSIVWHIFAAPQTLLLLMGLMAVALALGSLIPQVAPQAVGESSAWPLVQSGSRDSGEGLVAILGLADVYHSFWFRLLLIVSGLALFVRAADSAELAWRITHQREPCCYRRPAWEAQASRLRLSASLDLETARDRIAQLLSRHDQPWTTLDTEAVATLTAWRRPGAFWARPLGYAGLLVAALGLIIIDGWGWQDELWRPKPGESRAVGHSSPYVLRLESFDLESDGAGRLQGYGSRVAWLEDGITVHDARVGVGHPATFGGVTVRTVGFVPVVTLQAWDSQGNLLPLETEGQDLRIRTEVEVPFLWPDEQPLVFLPGQDRFLFLAFESRCGQAQPLLHVDLVREAGSEQVRLGSLTGSGELLGEDLQLDAVLSYVPLVRLEHRPGMALLMAGLALALGALACDWIAFPHLIWLVVEPRGEDKVNVQLVSLPGVRARHRLAQMIGRLQGVLADDG